MTFWMILLSVIAVLFDMTTLYFALRFWISDWLILFALMGMLIGVFVFILEWCKGAKNKMKTIKMTSVGVFVLFSVSFFIKSFGMVNGSEEHLWMMAPWILPLLAEGIMMLAGHLDKNK